MDINEFYNKCKTYKDFNDEKYSNSKYSDSSLISYNFPISKNYEISFSRINDEEDEIRISVFAGDRNDHSNYNQVIDANESVIKVLSSKEGRRNLFTKIAYLGLLNRKLIKEDSEKLIKPECSNEEKINIIKNCEKNRRDEFTRLIVDVIENEKESGNKVFEKIYNDNDEKYQISEDIKQIIDKKIKKDNSIQKLNNIGKGILLTITSPIYLPYKLAKKIGTKIQNYHEDKQNKKNANKLKARYDIKEKIKL